MLTRLTFWSAKSCPLRLFLHRSPSDHQQVLVQQLLVHLLNMVLLLQQITSELHKNRMKFAAPAAAVGVGGCRNLLAHFLEYCCCWWAWHVCGLLHVATQPLVQHVQCSLEVAPPQSQPEVLPSAGSLMIIHRSRQDHNTTRLST
jgi:hypothetical protein